MSEYIITHCVYKLALWERSSWNGVWSTCAASQSWLATAIRWLHRCLSRLYKALESTSSASFSSGSYLFVCACAVLCVLYQNKKIRSSWGEARVPEDWDGAGETEDWGKAGGKEEPEGGKVTTDQHRAVGTTLPGGAEGVRSHGGAEW